MVANTGWWDLRCINCGGGPTNQACGAHFYTNAEQLQAKVAELEDRIDQLEQRWKPPTPAPTQLIRKGGIPL